MVNLKWRDAMAVAGWHFTKTEQDIGWAGSMRPDQLAALQRPYIQGGIENRPGRWRYEAFAKAVTDACKGGDLAHIAKVLPGKAVMNGKIRVVRTWEGTRKEIDYTPSPKPKDVTEYQITAQAFAAWLAAPTQDEKPSAHIAAWLEAVGVQPQPQHEAAPLQSPAPPEQGKPERDTIKSVAWNYLVKEFKNGQYATAKEFFKGLELKAGKDDSPFNRGAGLHAGSLFVRALSKPMTLKTLENYLKEIRAESRLT